MINNNLKTESIFYLGDIHGNWTCIYDHVIKYDLKNCIIIQVGD